MTVPLPHARPVLCVLQLRSLFKLCVTCDVCVLCRGLSFGGFNLSGSIPASITRITTLTALDLSNNQLTSHIPVELFSMPRLVHVDLSHNGFTGTLPDLRSGTGLRARVRCVALAVAVLVVVAALALPIVTLPLGPALL